MRKVVSILIAIFVIASVVKGQNEESKLKKPRMIICEDNAYIICDTNWREGHFYHADFFLNGKEFATILKPNLFCDSLPKEIAKDYVIFGYKIPKGVKVTGSVNFSSSEKHEEIAFNDTSKNVFTYSKKQIDSLVKREAFVPKVFIREKDTLVYVVSDFPLTRVSFYADYENRILTMSDTCQISKTKLQFPGKFIYSLNMHPFIKNLDDISLTVSWDGALSYKWICNCSCNIRSEFVTCL